MSPRGKRMKSSIHQILIELRGDESEALRTVGRVHQSCRKETELVPGGDGTGGSGHSRRRTGIQVCKATVAQSRQRAEHGRAIINSSRSGLGASKGNGPGKPQSQGFVVSLSPDPILI